MLIHCVKPFSSVPSGLGWGLWLIHECGLYSNDDGNLDLHFSHMGYKLSKE
jgi:hypothetical protein